MKKARAATELRKRVPSAQREEEIRPSTTRSVTPRILVDRPEVAPETDPEVAHQLTARDGTITERDATIRDLRERLIAESDRVSRMTELFVAAQENDRQVRTRDGSIELSRIVAHDDYEP